MSSSESHSKKPFRLRVDPSLLTHAAIHGVDAQSIIEFAGAQIKAMMGCKPNCKIYGTKPIWVLRGYYPETPLFFKLTLVKGEEGLTYSYYARMSIPKFSHKKTAQRSG